VHHPELLGWLHTTTHFAAVNVIRTEQRRRRREEDAHAMHEFPFPSATADWRRLGPLLDAAMHDLSERDRQIVLLRYFDQQPFASIAVTLGITTNAAQKSAERALDRLHAALSRRGITSTAAALSIALGTEIALAAPAGLAANIAAGALASVTSTAATGILSFMTASKVSLAAAGVVAVAAIGFVLHERDATEAARSAAESIIKQQAATRAELARTRAELAATADRAKAAEEDSGKLLQAVTATRPIVTPTQSPPRVKKDTAYFRTLPRDQALVELATLVETMEINTRALPGYKPYTPPDLSRLPDEVRARLERNIATEKAAKKHYFVFISDDGQNLATAGGPSLVGGQLATKGFPQLTPEELQPFDERYARATIEFAYAKGAIPFQPIPRDTLASRSP
jgi:hypothetical protein